MSKRGAEPQAGGSSEEEEDVPSLLGNLRTSLKWDMGKKQLHLGEAPRRRWSPSPAAAATVP
jgi:hypothetical protein